MRRGTLPGILLLFVGCGKPAGLVFAPVEPPLVWPAPPDAARIRYVGQLRTSADLRPAKTGWQHFQEMLHGPEQPAALAAPHALALGPDEKLYVTDPASRSLHIFDLRSRQYTRVRQAGDQSLVGPAGVAVGPSTVFVADAGLACVHEFSPLGRFRRAFGSQVLKRPAGVAYCPENSLLYVVDAAGHRCVGFDAAGQPAVSFGQRGDAPGQFNYPTHVTYSPGRGLLIVDSLNFRVQRFTPEGRHLGCFGRKGNGAGDFSLPKGIATDGDGHVYVVDAHFENVQVFDPDGQVLMALGEEGSAPGQFSLPNGLIIDEHDRIWVADSYNRRVQVFQYLGNKLL